MRAALLPTPGDPFMVAYWLRNFARTWAREVDQLLVLVNGQNDPAALAYIEQQIQAACAQMHLPPRIIVGRELIDHGVALGQLLERTDADVVMLCEDDAWVRRPGEVAARFAAIEAGGVDVIGSPRGCGSAELLDRCWGRWPDVEYTIAGDAGHGLWPCFLFARRDVLLATDRHFGARAWLPGELVAGVGYVSDMPLSADTFVSTSLQLRARGVRIRHDPQYRVTDSNFFADWLADDPPWFHTGSLSSGYGFVFADAAGRARLDIGADTTTETVEWARRIYWWERFVETAPAGALPDQQARYWAELDRLVARTGTRVMVDIWAHAVAPWITWQE